MPGAGDGVWAACVDCGEAGARLPASALRRLGLTAAGNPDTTSEEVDASLTLESERRRIGKLAGERLPAGFLRTAAGSPPASAANGAEGLEDSRDALTVLDVDGRLTSGGNVFSGDTDARARGAIGDRGA